MILLEYQQNILYSLIYNFLFNAWGLNKLIDTTINQLKIQNSGLRPSTQN